MIRSVGYIGIHTSPLDQPGQGNAGGLNVYIHKLAHTMAERGVGIVVFTRRTSNRQQDVVEVTTGYQVVHITAGPAAPLPIAEIPPHIADFSEGILDWISRNEITFDLVHSHYWLAGWSGVILKEVLGIPLANSFHTLGRIKNRTRRSDETPVGPMRTLTEEELIAKSDCVIASTPYEFDDLLDHYGAMPERLCLSPPGIDHAIFKPGDRREARRWLGTTADPIVLYVGRIQAHKGIDVALRAVAAIERAHLTVIGGPSGQDGHNELTALHRLANDLGVRDRVHFLAPQPHDQLAAAYRAADVLVVPSRSESFGLVAAEAQACGLPVVATRVGGLSYVVEDGVSGILVDPHKPEEYTKALRKILEDPDLAERLAVGGITKAKSFSWSATADRLLELYRGITSG